MAHVASRPVRALLACLLAHSVAACSSDGGAAGPDAGVDPYRDPAAIEARLSATIDDLAALGDKRVGSAGGAAAGQLMHDRMVAAGLDDVHEESFSFPAYEVTASSLAITVDGQALPMEHDVFYYSGAGDIDAELVPLGTGHPEAYASVDVTGKVCLVVRDAQFHRSSQYRECVAHGGAALLYISQAPDNLIQIGTITLASEVGPIPSMTVGADDGAALLAALDAGGAGRAVMSVAISVTPGTGRNVVGSLPGTDPSGGYILLGAHYDTWNTGSMDNGTGAATLIELAEALARQPERRYGLVFVGYDGEEVGLFGGYDYLRDHVAVGHEPMLAFFNFEMPATGATDTRALGHTNQPELDAALSTAHVRSQYPLYIGMEVVPDVFGGVIPTDIQGMYWAGLAGFSTACDSPYYHTVADLPEQIDFSFLAQSAMSFADAVVELDKVPSDALTSRDPQLWNLAVSTSPAGADLQVDITVTDDGGGAREGALVGAYVEVDDFTRVFTGKAVSDADGKAQIVVPGTALTAGTASRWLHVSGGESYPLVEHITALP